MEPVKKQLNHTHQEDNVALKSILEIVLADEETKDVNPKNLSDILTASNYLEMRGKEKDGYVIKLNKYPSGWEITYIPTKDKAILDKRSSLFKVLGEEGRDLKASLGSFHVKTEKRKKALHYAKSMIKDLLDGQEVRGLYLHSDKFQIGKTYLANAIVNELADKGKTGVILFAPSWARIAKDFENEPRIRELKAADVVVIDDLGAEYRSEWFRTEILVPVLNARLQMKKLTIFTSNHSIIGLKEHYDELSKTKGETKDLERLVSRIYELADEVELDE